MSLKFYRSFTICSTKHKKGTAERAVGRRIFCRKNIFDFFYNHPERGAYSAA